MTLLHDSKRSTLALAAALAVAAALLLPATSLALSGTLKRNPDYDPGGKPGRAVTNAAGTRLTFKKLKLKNGPNLQVYLSAGSVSRVKRNRLGRSVRLGKLKKVRGTSSYAIPAGTDLDRYGTAVIWCKSAEVWFAVATLR